ncbi:MAG: PspC domain-containing protein, partial [Alistipes sp.]|nr:PspC domain-containing protein [Alistipes sp.]
MKDVKKCSLSGVAFTMDVDAYQTLNAYIESLRSSYGSSKDGEEIIADIEARIAELILSTMSGEGVVEKPLIDNIIRQMGSAADISESSDEGEPKAAEPRIPRRLYRDAESAKLGGVCAGLAKYFDTDPVWVRMVLLLPLLLTMVSGVLPGSWMM